MKKIQDILPTFSPPYNRIYNNLWARIISLVVAILLFTYVQSNRRLARIIQVRVMPIKLPAHLIQASKHPAYLKVHLSGPRELMDFPLSDFAIHLINPRPRADPKALFKTILSPALPEGIRASYRSGVILDIDHKMHRTLRLDPKFKINLPKKFRLGYHEIDPATIKIFGPRKIVMGMDQLKIRRLKIRNRPGIYEAKSLLEELPDFVRLAPRQPIEAVIRYRVIAEKPKTEAGSRITLLENIKVVCENESIDYSVHAHEKISIRLLLPEKVPIPISRQFEARTYCNRSIDKKTKLSVPNENVLLHIRDTKARKYITILEALPAQRTTIEFKRIIRNRIIRSGLDVFIKPEKKQ